MLTIENNHTDSYSYICILRDNLPLLPKWSRRLWNLHHSRTQCSITSHLANDLILLFTQFLHDTGQPDWSSPTTHQETSLILGDTISTLPIKIHHTWLKRQTTFTPILCYISQFEFKFPLWHDMTTRRKNLNTYFHPPPAILTLIILSEF